jgi:hypothetical protein
MSQRKTVKLDKKDYLRALLSDTTPGDVPLIFSNDGFYINSHRFESNDNSSLSKIVNFIYKSIIRPSDLFQRGSQSTPYQYKIQKNEDSYRTLSLIHPRAQRNFADFYESSAASITSWCSKSDISVRAPTKVGNSLYLYNSQPHRNYKEINIDTLESELFSKHSSSYFSYKGFSRLHKLYTSKKYIDLEKRYAKMWFIDVANCFDSIYTHSVSWAVKNKNYSQGTVRKGAQVCGQLDRLMQSSNNNETNGIPIGSEVSRVFAEIIFQTIDGNILQNLEKKYEHFHGEAFTILRYVDDFIVFSQNTEIMNDVYSEIQLCLHEYNMNVNTSKLEKFDRPFLTDRSMVILGVNKILGSLDDLIDAQTKVVDLSSEGSEKKLRRNSFLKNFIGEVKVLIAPTSQGYSSVSSYLISAISRKIIQITEQAKTQDTSFVLRTKELILSLMEAAFFFFRVSPSIVSSQKLATSIIVADRFFSDSHPQYISEFREEIIYEVKQIPFNSPEKNTISLEGMNILIAISDFNVHQLLSVNALIKIQNNVGAIGYFEIICLFYYYKNHNIYKKLREDLERLVSKKLAANFNLIGNSESLHIFLDLLSCPYVSKPFKKRFLLKFMHEYDAQTSMMQDGDISNATEELSKIFWFVNWAELDLLKLLERKELRLAY